MMRFRRQYRLSILLLACFSRGASAWAPKLTPSDAYAGIGTATTLALSNAAADMPTTTTREITIDADVPSIFRTVKDNRKTVVSSLRQLTGPSEALQQVYSPSVIREKLPTDARGALDADLGSLVQSSIGNRQTLLSTARDLQGTASTLTSLLSPSVSVALPSDLPGAARDALLSGQVSALLNGNPVGMTILPQDELVTVAIQSPLLPRLPLLEASSTLLVATTASFWDRPFFFQPQQYQLSNKNVIGGSALALGVTYAVSYGYYQYSIAEEEAEAQRKKEAMAAKRAAATAKAKEEEITTSDDEDMKEEESVEEQAEAVTVPPLSPDEKLAVEKARAAVEKAKREDSSTPRLERNQHVEEDEVVDELSDAVQEEEVVEEIVTRRKRSLWKFWRWMKRDYVES